MNDRDFHMLAASGPANDNAARTDDMSTSDLGIRGISYVSQVSGIPERRLIQWELRYKWPKPAMGESGYRLYDSGLIKEIIKVKALLDQGLWIHNIISKGRPVWPEQNQVVNEQDRQKPENAIQPDAEETLPAPPTSRRIDSKAKKEPRQPLPQRSTDEVLSIVKDALQAAAKEQGEAKKHESHQILWDKLAMRVHRASPKARKHIQSILQWVREK